MEDLRGKKLEVFYLPLAVKILAGLRCLWHEKKILKREKKKGGEENTSSVAQWESTFQKVFWAVHMRRLIDYLRNAGEISTRFWMK